MKLLSGGPGKYALIFVLLFVMLVAAWRCSPMYAPPLSVAARNGDASQVAEQISNGADLNRRVFVLGTDYYSGWTATMWAAYKGHADIVQMLVDSGADLTVQDKGGRTALHLALERDGIQSREACLKVLLRAGANPNTASNNGTAPLHSAVFRQDVACVALLIDNGANVNADDGNGNSIISTAVSYTKRLDIVQLLLEKGADVCYPLASGGRYYEAAIKGAKTDSIKEIIKNAAQKCQ